MRSLRVPMSRPPLTTAVRHLHRIPSVRDGRPTASRRNSAAARSAPRMSPDQESDHPQHRCAQKSVDACVIAGNHAVTLVATEPHQCLQACAKIIRAVPHTRRIIRYDERHRRPQRRIVLDHHNARAHRRDRLPNPVVVVVNIDAEEIDLASHAGLLAQRVDVFRGRHILAEHEFAIGDE